MFAFVSARKKLALTLVAAAGLTLGLPAQAHFLTLFPSTQVVDQGDSRDLQMPVYFTHPATMGPAMDIQQPKSATLLLDGQTSSLTDQLKPKQFSDKQGWMLDYSIRRPGVYTFGVEQAPYFDETEQAVLIQYPKVVVSSFAGDGDWQALLGSKVEIQPLTRPYALWTGSSFSGRVLVDGQPASGIVVEMEHYNSQRQPLPSDVWASQGLVTNSQGEFTVSLTKAGWWGIAAIYFDPKPYSWKNKQYPLEHAGVIWLQARDH